MSEEKSFSESQKQYLSGFVMGADVARAVRGLPILSGSVGTATPPEKAIDANTSTMPEPPEAIAYEAQSRTLADGKKLSNEEKAKRENNPLDRWEEIEKRSAAGEFPKGTDVFLTKFHGLFYVAPAQDSYMCRLRIPGGELQSYQLTGLADLADRSAGGYLDLTTRANVQLREIPADQAMEILYGVRELGLVSLGSGGDNIRNVTASPLSGIDRQELIETIPIARRMHHFILNHREMYGLPRKFNIAYDGGGSISALDDTNDIGFHAVRVPEEQASSDVPAGIYFQLTLGGITGHLDFARGTGILLKRDETIPVAAAIIRVFIRNGDRTDRKKARLKYVLDDWGFDKFIAEVEAELGHPLRKFPDLKLSKPDHEIRDAHVDFHRQAQQGKNYVGVVFPVGRMTSDQARGLADIAQRYGTGKVRLTVWQNLLIPDIADADCDQVRQAILELGLHYSATHVRAGLIACTGSAGCKFAASNTKRNAMEIADFLEQQFELDTPINIHLTGCHHSCAQHYIGDIGLIATKVEVGEDMVDGYDVLVGGGWGARQGIARMVAEKVPFEQVPSLVAGIVQAYLDQRECGESFNATIRRQSDSALLELGSRLMAGSPSLLSSTN